MSNPFALTKRVCIELSNRCNYAYAHKRCPLHNMRGNAPVILPARIVEGVLNDLGRHNFNGLLSFHLYNEPMVDPRLFQFIEYAHAVCPGACIDICTNGSYINQTMIDELTEAGVCSLRVSCYSKKEYARLSKLTSKAYYKAKVARLDPQVLLFYQAPRDGTRTARQGTPCLAPLFELNITRDGKLGLCFLDWAHKHTFGDLRKQRLSEIVASDEVQETAARLRKGDRFLALCKTCGRSRTQACVVIPPHPLAEPEDTLI